MARHDGFRHEAFLYADEAAFLGGTVPFIRDAVAADEPILVVVDAAKITALRSVLNGEAGRVQFADMAAVGRNPARIIPAWRAFVDQHRACGRRLRGIGEPIWAGRSADEMVECRHHEALLNTAFREASGFWLRCPYDVTALEPAVVDGAHGTHPLIGGDGHGRRSDHYPGPDPDELLQEALPGPPTHAERCDFGSNMIDVRHRAARHAAREGFGDLADDVALVVGELTANSVRHGGGGGALWMWSDRDALVYEVRDRGRITDPLVGRRPPADGQIGRRGLWMVNQLCDLVQVRSTPAGTAVRARISRHALR